MLSFPKSQIPRSEKLLGPQACATWPSGPPCLLPPIPRQASQTSLTTAPPRLGPQVAGTSAAGTPGQLTDAAVFP
ncbi:MAG: hypothetical protein WCP70_08600 [Methanothrix sp.]